MRKFNYTFFMIALALVLAGVPLHTVQAEGEPGVAIGAKITEFSAVDQAGNSWRLSENLNNDYLVVYFYPAALTSGCTKQACNVRDQKAELAKLKTDVVGVSGDRVENLAYFKEMHQLNFTLLSDSTGSIAELFAVPVRDGGAIKKEIDGKEQELVRYNTFSRWTYILDKSATVIYKNTAVNAASDIDEIISFLKQHE